MDNNIIIEAISRYFDTHPDVVYATPAELNEYLAKINVLNDSSTRKGLPLRKWLRNNRPIFAYQIGKFWRIERPNMESAPHSPIATKKSCLTATTKEPKPTPSGIQCFDPIVDEQSTILILGTMPGTQSLKSGEYYAASSNSFWKIISALYNNNKPFASYEEKIECLHTNHIALWDIYQSCERESALDKDIRNEVPNDINGFLKAHPSIKVVIVNGKTLAKSLNLDRPFLCAGSTSNTNAKPLDVKIEEWRNLLQVQEQKQ